MTSDAIVLLKDDHKEILGVFRDFEERGRLFRERVLRA